MQLISDMWARFERSFRIHIAACSGQCSVCGTFRDIPSRNKASLRTTELGRHQVKPTKWNCWLFAFASATTGNTPMYQRCPSINTGKKGRDIIASWLNSCREYSILSCKSDVSLSRAAYWESERKLRRWLGQASSASRNHDKKGYFGSSNTAFDFQVPGQLRRCLHSLANVEPTKIQVWVPRPALDLNFFLPAITGNTLSRS